MQGAVAGGYEDSVCPSSRISLALRSLVPHSLACARLPAALQVNMMARWLSMLLRNLGVGNLASP
jgi:hypothetical protein